MLTSAVSGCTCSAVADQLHVRDVPRLQCSFKSHLSSHCSLADCNVDAHVAGFHSTPGIGLHKLLHLELSSRHV